MEIVLEELEVPKRVIMRSTQHITYFTCPRCYLNCILITNEEDR